METQRNTISRIAEALDEEGYDAEWLRDMMDGLEVLIDTAEKATSEKQHALGETYSLLEQIYEAVSS